MGRVRDIIENERGLISDTVATDKEVVSYLVNNSTSVPNEQTNRHFKEIQEWIAQGNTPAPQYTDEELIAQEIEAKRKEFNTAIYKYLNDTCSAYKFGDSKTEPFRAISNYTGYDNEYREIAEKLGAWVAEVFKAAEQIEEDVANGDREMPTVEEVLEELLEELPTFEE